MPTKNITQLPAAAALSGTEVVPAIQSGVDVKVTASALYAPALARATHTGVQAISTITGLQAALDGKSTAALATDQIIYVGRGTSASDTNDGLSPGKPKATVAAACAALTTGGVVQMMAGTFALTLTAHPQDASYMVGAVVRPNTILRGLGAVTKLRLADNQPTGYCLMNLNIAPGGDTGIVFEDFLLDGNNATQGVVTHHGITLIRANGAKFNRVVVTNLKGTTGAGATENFYFDGQLSSNFTYTDCSAVCTVGPSSSGFSANGCTGFIWKNCVATGMTVANGFTHNSCTDLTYDTCRSQLNAGAGLNCEVGNRIKVIGGTYGGKAVTGTSSNPYTDGQVLGNTGNGVVCNVTTNLELIGVDSSYNTGSGVFAQGRSSGRIVGGNYSNSSAGYGISLLGAVNVSNKALTSNVATLTTTTAHGLVTGSIVDVTGVGAPFDGTWTLTGVPTTTTLTYARTNADIASVASTGIVSEKGPWRITGKPRVADNNQGASNIAPLGFTNLNGLMATPTMPAAGVPLLNPFPFDTTVLVTGGTVNFVSVDGTNTQMIAGTFPIRAGGTITINYSVAPAWLWFAGAAA